ncbi:MAG: nitrate/nitrite transporter NrtS [Vicinamibacteria bacterium]|nr:nitrate/nitrite transporter NrtS [Vicinamibacteria bacterium]
MDKKQAAHSARVALVVAPVLVVVNHYEDLARGHWRGLGIKALLTLAVPFCVSYYSARAARRRGVTPPVEGSEGPS